MFRFLSVASARFNNVIAFSLFIFSSRSIPASLFSIRRTDQLSAKQTVFFRLSGNSREKCLLPFYNRLHTLLHPCPCKFKMTNNLKFNTACSIMFRSLSTKRVRLPSNFCVYLPVFSDKIQDFHLFLKVNLFNSEENTPHYFQETVTFP